MRIRYAVIGVIMILVSACASVSDSEHLYSSYENYVKNVNRKNIDKIYHEYFTSTLLDGESIGDPEVADQLLFKSYMSHTDSHFQSIRNSQGCLSVNGFDKENMPINFRLRYLKSQAWLIDSVQVRFVNNVAEFDKQAICPGSSAS